MESIALEAAEALIPLTLAGVWFGRSAHRERRRIELEARRVELERAPAQPAHPGTLDRLHAARMRRRALRMMARPRSSVVR